MSNPIENRVVMVTGGAGFIGSHLVRRILKENPSEIIILDSFRYGDVSNIEDLLVSGKVRIVEHTLGAGSIVDLESEMQDVDYLFHLAAEKHNQSKDSPLAVIDANIKGTLNLFEVAASVGVKKTVFTSSLYAYGKTNGLPFKEVDLPVPNTIYGISKLAGERLLDYTVNRSDMKGNVLRYFFVYGPKQYAGMGYKSVILKNFERLRKNSAPVIHGDGNQSLDYVYVDDAVEATLQSMISEASGLTLNVGSGSAVTINELTHLMQEIARTKINPVHNDPDWTEGTHRAGDISEIKRVLHWKPKLTLEEGLALTFKWMANNE